MKRLLLLMAWVSCGVGCSDPPQNSWNSGDPFANSVRFSDLALSQAHATASSAKTVEQLGAMHATEGRHLEEAKGTNTLLSGVRDGGETTNSLLSQLIDQQKAVAGQQCDILQELQSLRQASEPEGPEPQLAEGTANVPHSPPLWPPEKTKPQTIPTAPVGAMITVGGETVPLANFIAQWYKRSWTYPGTIDAHLAEHGVNVSQLRLSHATKERLHAAIHEREQSLRTPAAKPAPAAPPPAVTQRSACPGGVCPAPSWQPVRRGLFGRRR